MRILSGDKKVLKRKNLVGKLLHLNSLVKIYNSNS